MADGWRQRNDHQQRVCYHPVAIGAGDPGINGCHMERRSGVFGRVSLVLALIIGATGCGSGPVVPGHHAILQSTASSVTGTWKEIAPPGSTVPRDISMDMSLTASDTTLTGTATYSTSGGSGQAQVAGYVFWQPSGYVPAGHVTVSHPEVVLDLTLDDGLSAHIDQATLLEPDTLSGVLVFSDDSSASWDASFARVVQ